MASLAIRNVRKIFPNGGEVLKGIDLEIEDGQFLILVGGSGCGKSTLLNMIAGLESVTSGDIFIGGKRVNDLAPKDRDIAMVFQSYALYPSMSVRDNIAFGLSLRKVAKAEQARIIERVAATLQIGHLLDRKPAQLSGGQRQRVAMGRALAREPQLFLFDEPLSNLDAQLRVEMRAEIKLMHKRLGTTIVYVTHDQIEAMTLGDRIAVMKDGVVQQFGSPQEIYDQPANLFVAGFMGSPPMNLIRGKLVKVENATENRFGVEVKIGGAMQCIQLPAFAAHFDAYQNREIILGLRPEHLTDLPRAGEAAVQTIECPIEFAEPTGADCFIHTRFGESTVIARIHPAAIPANARALKLAVDTAKAVLFDSDTDRRIV